MSGQSFQDKVHKTSNAYNSYFSAKRFLSLNLTEASSDVECYLLDGALIYERDLEQCKIDSACFNYLTDQIGASEVLRLMQEVSRTESNKCLSQ